MKKIVLVLLILVMLTAGVFAITDLKMKDLIIPSTYNELLEAYRDVVSIAIGYQRLYQESEADNQILLQTVQNLQSLMKVQQGIIDDLLQRNRFSLFGGFNYVPLEPTYSGIIVGITFEF